MYYYNGNLWEYSDYRNLAGTSNIFGTEKVLLNQSGVYEYTPSETPCNQLRAYKRELTTKENAIREIERELSIRRKCVTLFYFNSQLYDYASYTNVAKKVPDSLTPVVHMDENNQFFYSPRSPCNPNFRKTLAYQNKESVLSAVAEDLSFAKTCSKAASPMQIKDLIKPPDNVRVPARAPTRPPIKAPAPQDPPRMIVINPTPPGSTAADPQSGSNNVLWLVLAIVLGFLLLGAVIGLIFFFMSRRTQ